MRLGEKSGGVSPRLHLPLLLLGLVATAPAPAHADEPVRPLQSRPEALPPRAARARVALVGLSLTAGFYALSLGASFLYPEAPGAEALRIPVAGPWLSLAETGCPGDDPDCSLFPVVLRAVLTSLDAVAQVGGVAIASESLWMPTRREADAGVHLSPLPVGRGGIGLGLRGRF